MSLPHARPLVLLFLCCLVLVGANFQVRVPQRHTNVHPKLVSYTNTHTEFIEEEEQLKESAPVLFAPTTTAPLTNNNNNHNVLNAHNKVTRHNNKHSHSHHHHRNNNNDDEVPIEMRVKNMDSILSKAEAVLRSLTGLPLLQQQQQPLQPQPQPQPKQQQEQPRQQQQQEQQQPQQPPPQPQQQQQQQQQPLSTSSGPATISQTSPTSTSSVSPPATAAPASPAASSASAVVTHAELAESVSEKKRQTHPSQPAQIALGESEAEHGIAPPPVTHTKVFPPPPSSSSSPSTPSSPASPSTATSLSSSSSTPDHDEAAEAGAKPKSDDDDDDEEDDKETVGKALDSEMKMSGSVCAGRYEHFYFDMPSCNLSSYLVIIKPQDNGACALVDWADVYFKNGSIANADDYDVMTSLPSGETSTYLRFVTPQPPSSRFYIAVRGTDSLSSPCNFQIDIKFGPDVCVTPKEPLHFCSMVDYPVLNEDIFQSDFLQMKDAYVKTKFDVLALRSEGRCIDATKNFLCSVNFQRCNPHGLALRPCRSVCDEYAESCSLDSVAFDPSDPEKPGCPTDKYADVECTKADPVSLEEAV